MAEEAESKAEMVKRLSPRLTGKQRRFLSGLAHDRKPIVQIGQRGISEGLIENFEAALLAHELVKVKVHEGEGLSEAAQALHQATGAQLAQQIGFILVFYRPHPKSPTLRLPK
jgi:RNA-binding protein